MRTCVLGPLGWQVPVQGLGCMRMYEEADAAILDRAIDLGVSFLDTADLYGRGRNEEIVGRIIGKRRDQVQLCTKFGVVPQPDDTWIARGDAAYVRESCEASLRRLGIDVIDLFYMHRRDPGVPIEETVGAMADLVTAGKVRYLGLSAVTGDELRAAMAVHPITAVQSEWSLVAREVEEMVPVCAELGVGVVPYSPQGGGRLTGAGTEDADLELVRALQAVAHSYGATPTQIALAWVHQRAQAWRITVVPLPGTTKLAHLEANIAAADIALTATDIARIEGACAVAPRAATTG